MPVRGAQLNIRKVFVMFGIRNEIIQNYTFIDYFNVLISLYSTHPPFIHTIFHDPKPAHPADMTAG
jgi:hypothetical protein